MHIHSSFPDAGDARAAYDPQGRHRLEATIWSLAAGVLAHVDAIMASSVVAVVG